MRRATFRKANIAELEAVIDAAVRSAGIVLVGPAAAVIDAFNRAIRSSEKLQASNDGAGAGVFYVEVDEPLVAAMTALVDAAIRARGLDLVEAGLFFLGRLQAATVEEPTP